MAMQSISGFERRFIPAAEFDADMGRMPVDDSGVVVMGQNDREELNDWIDAQASVDYDEAFGAAEVQRVDVRHIPEEVASAQAETVAIDALIEMLQARRDAAQAVVCRHQTQAIMSAAERGAFSSFAAA
jgi:hypothetical protein